MIKSHKKVISGILVGLAIFGGVFQCKGVLAQAAGISSQQEERLNAQQKRDLVLKREIQDYIELSGKYYILRNLGFEPVISKNVKSLSEFIQIERSLQSGKNYMIHVRSAIIFIKVK